MSDKRITPADVQAAYAATGLKPQRKNIYTVAGCCCGLGVMAAAGMGDDPDSDRWCWVHDTYGVDYVDGFYMGFDGWDSIDLCYETRERTWQGYEDGKAAALAVFGAPAS